jgi:hypothetical protein
MRLSLFCSIAILVSPAFCVADVSDYKVKSVEKAPPKELKEEVQKLLDKNAIQFTDKDGGVIAEIWLRKPIPVSAEPKDKKATYRQVPATSIIGAVQFAKEWKEYRGKKVPPGVYSLRLAMQPQDGNHMGTSPFPEFAVLVAAKHEPGAATMEVEELVERSMASIKASHPGVLLLFPNDKAATAPSLEGKANEHIVLNAGQEVAINGKTAGTLGIGLTLVGHANE